MVTSMECSVCREAKKQKNRQTLIEDDELAEALRAWVYVWGGVDKDVPFDEAYAAMQEAIPWAPLTPIIDRFYAAGKFE